MLYSCVLWYARQNVVCDNRFERQLEHNGTLQWGYNWTIVGFSSSLVHGILPESTISVVLVPIVKKTNQYC